MEENQGKASSMDGRGDKGTSTFVSRVVVDVDGRKLLTYTPAEWLKLQLTQIGTTKMCNMDKILAGSIGSCPRPHIVS